MVKPHPLFLLHVLQHKLYSLDVSEFYPVEVTNKSILFLHICTITWTVAAMYVVIIIHSNTYVIQMLHNSNCILAGQQSYTQLTKPFPMRKWFGW